jgi:hypothetical protein
MSITPTPNFTLPLPKTIKTADGQQVQVYDAISLKTTLTQIQAAISALGGQATGGTQTTGPLNVNNNVISGVANSDDPSDDEAVSFGLAQQNYTTYRRAVNTQTGNYQIQATDGTVRAKAASVPTNQQLPPASTVLGKCFTVTKSDPTSNAVYVTTSMDPITGKMDTINGQPNYKLTAIYKYVTVQAMQTGVYEVTANN